MRQSEFSANSILAARITQGWTVGANFHKPGRGFVAVRRVSLFARVIRALVSTFC